MTTLLIILLRQRGGIQQRLHITSVSLPTIYLLSVLQLL